MVLVMKTGDEPYLFQGRYKLYKEDGNDITGAHLGRKIQWMNKN